MKRILLLTMAMSAIQITFAEAADVDQSIEKVDTLIQNSTETITGAERIVDKYSGKIMGVIESLAESLKVPASHVYKVLVTQQIAEGVASLLPLIFLLASLWYTNYLSKNLGWQDRHFYSSDWQGEDDAEKRANWRKAQINHKNFMFIALCCLSIVLLIMTLTNISEGIIKLINPEYGAIQEIFSLIKAF